MAILTAILATALAALAGASPAFATSASWWDLNATVAPTLLPHRGEAQIILTVNNRGYGEVNTGAEPVILTDTLPAGVKPVKVPYNESPYGEECHISGQTVTCTFTGKRIGPFERLGAANFPLLIIVNMEEPNPSEPLENVVKIEGGGVPSPPPLRKLLTLQKTEGEKTPFGVETYEVVPENEQGLQDSQAGSHPFQLTTRLDLNQRLEPCEETKETACQEIKKPGFKSWPSAPALPRNLHFKLPAGLVGDPSAVPRCSEAEFKALPDSSVNACPADTAVGVASVIVFDPGPYTLLTRTNPVFNLQPAQGEPARFGFLVENVPIILKTAVPSGGDYGIEVSVEDVSQAVAVLQSEVTLWGVPGDPRHAPSRGWQGCTEEGPGERCEAEGTPKAFLDLPTSCSQAPTTSVSGESWAAGNELPAVQLTGNTEYTFPTPLTGCDTLEFDPSLSVVPEQHSASTPTGLNVGVEMPQPGLLAPAGDLEAALKQTTVKLPPGLLLNPAAANALQDCTAKEFDFLDVFDHPFGEEGVAEVQQTGNETFPSPFSPEPPDCPQAAKVGTVNIATPLLPHELTGSVYLAAQNVNPFSSPLAVYLLAEDPAEGIRVKLAGTVEPEAGTGQLTSTFKNTPQLPFTALHLHFFGGERASLSTPPTCAPATTTSEFIPWASEIAPAHPESAFQNTSGAGGGPCPSTPLPFSPSFRAGPSSPQAGAFSSDVVDIGRPDGDQPISGVSVTLPPGFAGVLASVTPCPEPPAGQEWSCGESSHIGEAKEYSGLGSEPVELTGQAYLTTGYDGAPFGLLVRTHAAAGPFDLGWVNVRSRINVNPNTAQVTVTTDPGPRDEALPTMLDGVPVQLKALEVAVNRPDFTFNPTSCEPFEVTATLNGGEGAADPLSIPFKAEGCSSLPFHPTLEASTQGAASKVDGASLTVKVTSQGLGVANIAKTKLTLPIALPSRLSTIQKACPDTTFESTPGDPGADCDEGSVIGEGIAHTPILKSTLSGPAYLVSHGGAAFPDVEFVLKGEGILLVLDGKTDIVKGITTSEFNSVPDAPVSTFEAILPTGPHSALGAYASASNPYDFCGSNLVMPTVITGQNGAVIEQETHINVTGCAAVKSFKTKKLTLAQQLAKALKKCRSTYKHSASKRAACERKAHATYTAKAIAECRKADKHSSKKRKTCEVAARKAYAARAARKKG